MMKIALILMMIKIENNIEYDSRDEVDEPSPYVKK